MGEVLPPKRQTVVDRLKRRLEIYRRHQGSCLPRYDQAANGIYDAQRQETLLLKQKFLEGKAKKTKRSDNRHATQRESNLNNSVTNNNAANNVNNCDTKANIVAQSKLKRAAGSPLLDCAIEGLNDNHPNKIPRNSTPDHPNNSNQHQQQQQQQQKQQQQQQQQTGMPSFSVQIVQQFTSSNTSKSPHSQTIQTNVTVQALSGGQIKTSNSPMTTTTASPGVQSGDTGTNVHSNASGNSGTPGASSTSISVGTNIECKQEPSDNNFAPCSISANRTLNNDLDSDLSNNLNNNNGTHNLGAGQGTATLGDRFSDSLANLGFPEDSSDDVIHPDILKDIIDDVFTNPSDLMNGFSFVDNLKDTSGNNVVDDKDSSLRNVLGNNKTLTSNNPSSTSMSHFQNNMGPGQFSVSQSQQAVFDFHSGNINNTPNVNASQGFPQTRMSTYVNTSSNLNNMNNNTPNSGGLGLDFKLTEPSPAAQTLKQMAEQHQSMQQKQQQMGHLHPRSPFGSDSFPDPLSNIRSNFLNGSPTSIMQKSPNGLFQSMGFNNTNNNQQQVFPGATPVKQEVGSPVPPIYTGINSPPVQLADLEQLHKRRQQALQLQQQQQQQQQQQKPPFSHSPDQKPLGINPGGGPTAYMSTRPLSHYNDPMSMSSAPSHGSASNSPVSHPGQFMRGVSTPGVTPPPPQNFASSPSSGAALHLSQSQQLQISQGPQQLQVSQSQQQLLVSQDLKPSISPQAQQQQQQHAQSRNFYPGHHSTVHMSQSQSVNFQFGGNSRACSPNTVQRTQMPSSHSTSSTAAQRQMQQQYANRPPPDYQSPLDTNAMNIGQHQQQQAPSINPQADNRMGNSAPRGRKGLQSSQSYMPTQNQMDHNIPSHSSNSNLLISRTTPPPPVTATGGRGRGAKANSRSNAGSNKQGYPRIQRPPNVNVGPEGLNISQRPPGMSTDWRHLFMQQQQQINTSPPIRIPFTRGPMPSNYAQNTGLSAYPGTNTVQMDPNSSMVPGSGGMSRNEHIGANTMPQMAGATASDNVQFLMQQQQQQQAMLHSGLGVNANTLMSASQMQMATATTGGMSARDANQPQPNMFSNDPKIQSNKLDDTSQSIADSNQFILDFLDNIDCSTSDLLNFDMSGSGSSFPLLEDMSKMLGQ